jgi:uncharacterized protein (DUF1697 family)
VRSGYLPGVGATSYVALLRGVNVGGRNLVAMSALREAFEAAGHQSVSSYIQSGQVLFESDAPRASLERDLEVMLERRFGVPLVVVLRSHQQLRNVIARAPAGFGSAPDRYHSDAIFLKAPLTPAQAMRVVKVRDGVDQAWPGSGVLYFARLSQRRTQSRLSSIVGTPEYRLMTIRSWKTTTKLLNLLDERRS